MSIFGQAPGGGTATSVVSALNAIVRAINALSLAISSGTAGVFTTLTTGALHLDTGTKTATATSGAATLNKQAGVVTSESITTAAGSDYTLTITNSNVVVGAQIFASVQLGTATTGEPAVTSVTSAAGSVVIKIRNIAASAAFNGTILISFVIFQN